MPDIVSMIVYLQARRVGDTMEIAADADDPVLLQAQADGFVDWVDGKWIARGNIQPGERRVVRHYGGGTTEVIGE